MAGHGLGSRNTQSRPRTAPRCANASYRSSVRVPSGKLLTCAHAVTKPLLCQTTSNAVRRLSLCFTLALLYEALALPSEQHATIALSHCALLRPSPCAAALSRPTPSPEPFLTRVLSPPRVPSQCLLSNARSLAPMFPPQKPDSSTRPRPSLPFIYSLKLSPPNPLSS